MIKYTHVEGFHTVVKTAQHRGIDTVVFEGTVKLHGTNAGVTVVNGELFPQSRNRRLTLEDDNNGFGRFALSQPTHHQIERLAADVVLTHDVPPGTPVTLYGEWCGPGIQKGTAVNQLKDKHWVLFAAKVGEGDDSRYVAFGDAFDEILDASAQIDSVFDATRFLAKLDFNDRESMLEVLEEMKRFTEFVGLQCPYAGIFAVEGPGEGIVWTPVRGHAQFGNSELFFKTKSKQFERVSKTKQPVAVDPEVFASVQAFVKAAVTDGRLEQGLQVLAEQGLPVEVTSTGSFLKWVGQDVRRECAGELEASGLEWKQVGKEVNNYARGFFKRKVEQL